MSQKAHFKTRMSICECTKGVLVRVFLRTTYTYATQITTCSYVHVWRTCIQQCTRMVGSLDLIYGIDI
jgi:hypothetical protein